MLIQLACSVAGRNHLYGIFENFLPIMAYWVCPWLTIVIEEHVIFHLMMNREFDWTIWEDKKKLPLGVTAMLAWLIGWAGAILGMAQVWYTGPIALRVGGWGGKFSSNIHSEAPMLTWFSIHRRYRGMVGRRLRRLNISSSQIHRVQQTGQIESVNVDHLCQTSL
jgi:purine-cytosine permease-like protein